MFRRSVPILLHPAFLDLVVAERVVCLTSYVEISREIYERERSLSDRKRLPTPAFRFASAFAPGELPPQAEGAYYSRLPSARIDGVLVQGEAIAENLSERHFRLRSYALLDLDDRTIRSGEKSDAAVWVCGIDHEGCLRPFYNAIAYETASKAHPMRSLRIAGAPPVLFVYQPFAGVPLSECSMTLRYNDALGFRANVDGWERPSTSEATDLLGHMTEALPSIALISGGGAIAPEEKNIVGIELRDASGQRIARNATVYLEATGGYLPRRRVALTDGEGSFPVIALGLETGDSFKIKAGFRNFSGVLDIPFTVV